MDAEEREAKVNEYAFYATVAAAVLAALAPVAVYLGALVRLFDRVSGRKR